VIRPARIADLEGVMPTLNYEIGTNSRREIMTMHGYIARCAMLDESRAMYRAFLFTDARSNPKPNSILWAVIPQRTVDSVRREELPIDP